MKPVPGSPLTGDHSGLRLLPDSWLGRNLPVTLSRMYFPRPTTPLPSSLPFAAPNHLAPLSPPPSTQLPPRIPESCGFDLEGWQRTTHILPAAYPRRPTLSEPTCEVTIDDIWKRRQDDYDGRDKRLKTSHDGTGPVLWSVVDRFTRTDVSSAAKLTLVLTHGAGLYRRSWDTMISHLLAHNSPASELVCEVWTMDAYTHGDGGLVNAGKLPDICKYTFHPLRSSAKFLRSSLG